MKSIDHIAPALRTALTDFMGVLRGRFGGRLREVSLFGSVARGEAHEESDVDVFVVVDDVTFDERGWIAEQAGLFWLRDVCLSPTVMPSTKVALWRAQQRPLTNAIAEEGIAIDG